MSTGQHDTRTGTSHGSARLAPLSTCLLIGALAQVAALGIWWIGYQAEVTPFPPFDLADQVIRATPGDVAVWAIANLQFRAHDLALLAGITAFIAAGAGVGALLRGWPGARTGAIAGAAGGLITGLLALANDSASGIAGALAYSVWFGATLAALLAAAGNWVERLQIDSADSARAQDDWSTMNAARTRRQVLRSAALLAIGLGGGGWIAGRLVRNAGLGVETADAVPLDSRIAELTASATAPLALPTPVPAGELPDEFIAPSGVRPRLTSNEDFYVIDITTRKPALPDDDWTLTVHGLVDQPIELSYLDLLGMPSVEQDGTLMCISYTYGSELISNTRWTGVPLRDVLRLAGIQDAAVDVVLRGAGGYSDSIPVSKALEAQTLLAYGMNGETLPRDHGYPCRLYVPDIYGEKNVKWLQEIELVNFDYQGYWQERGWSDAAVVNTFSVIDTPSGSAAINDVGAVPIGGVAFAGSRGIQSVRVRIDDGEWFEADLEPYDPELVWQRWRYDWQASPGEHIITAQAIDGTGSPQETDRSEPFPDGMTGLHEVTVQVS